MLARLQADPARDPITVLARRAVPGVTRARAVLLDFASLADFDPFPPADAVLWALGAAIAAAGSRDAFRRVDHGYVVALPRRAQRRRVPQ